MFPSSVLSTSTISTPLGRFLEPATVDLGLSLTATPRRYLTGTVVKGLGGSGVNPAVGVCVRLNVSLPLPVTSVLGSWTNG